MAKELERLMEWYAAQCDGDWEHQNGIKLGTLDNPGWCLDVALADTAAADRTYAQKLTERSPDDWVFVEVVDDTFRGRCGPGNLVEMLGLFLDFVRENPLEASNEPT